MVLLLLLLELNVVQANEVRFEPIFIVVDRTTLVAFIVNQIARVMRILFVGGRIGELLDGRHEGGQVAKSCGSEKGKIDFWFFRFFFRASMTLIRKHKPHQ